LEKIIDLVRETMEEAQRMATNLRPSILDDMGILAAIQWVARKFQEIYSNVIIKTDLGISEVDIPEPLKIVILRIVQEALNNIAKHSKADSIYVGLKRNGTGLELIVEDNGKGFHPEKIQSKSNPEGGMGLNGMRERAELYKGTFRIDSEKGKGSILQVFWPLDKSTSKAD
jgi:signal transduction histidine kinase